jgi:hypothetical protein
MEAEKIFYRDEYILVSQNKLLVGADRYDIDKINHVKAEEQFSGFTFLGWIVFILGVITLPVYGIGVVVILFAYMYFPNTKYVIKILFQGKLVTVLKTKDLEHIKKVKRALNEAIDISMAHRAMKY